MFKVIKSTGLILLTILLIGCPTVPVTSIFTVILERTDIKIWDKVTAQVIAPNPYNHQYEYRFWAERGKVISDNISNPYGVYYSPFTGGKDTIKVTVFDRNDNTNLTPITYPVTVNGDSMVYIDLGTTSSTLADNTNGLIKIASLRGLSQTKDVAYGREPSISPDGKYIAYTYFPGDGSSQIYIKDPAGNEVNLTNHRSFNMEPCWSPIGADGQLYLAFSSDRISTGAGQTGGEHGEFYHIWQMNVNGSDLRQVTNTAGNDREPTWAPDGRSIVYSSDYYQNKANNFRNLYKIDITTRQLNALTNETVAQKGCYQPAFSPDGQKLTYMRKYIWRQLQQEVNMQKIWLIDFNQANAGFGRIATRQTDATTMESSPSWTVDNRNITYVKNRGTEYSVVSIPFDSIPINNNQGSIIDPILEGGLMNAIEAQWARQSMTFGSGYSGYPGYGSGVTPNYPYPGATYNPYPYPGATYNPYPTPTY